MLFWWSAFAFAAPSLSWPLKILAGISPTFLTFLLMKVSGIPILESENNKKYGEGKQKIEYEKYKQSTNLLIPLPKFKLFKQNKD